MDSLLWQHADAEEGKGNLQRPLTTRGEKQAQAQARWLRQHQPKDLHILGPEACVSYIISTSGWPSASGAALVVGHQPALGRMASLLRSGQEADWTIKKGALWWFINRVRQGETQTVMGAELSS